MHLVEKMICWLYGHDSSAVPALQAGELNLYWAEN